MQENTTRLMAGGAIFVSAALLLTMLLWGPSDLGPFGLTLWFTGLFLVLLSTLTLGLSKLKYGENYDGFMLSLRRSFLISMWIVAILALGSLRQLVIRDIILLTILGLLIDFYMQRAQR